jgi:hypothetical protein
LMASHTDRVGEMKYPGLLTMRSVTTRMTSQTLKEWENEVLHTAATPKRSMLPEHIFALAQVIGRPIICVGPMSFSRGAGVSALSLPCCTSCRRDRMPDWQHLTMTSVTALMASHNTCRR